MKKVIIVLIGVVVLGTSCKKYLDINKNPNAAISATPETVLPQAMTYTASVSNSYNTYGAQMVGYMANAGGYGGFGSNVTYDFGTTDYQGLWSSAYDVLEDLQYILKQTDTLPDYGYFNAAARILKAYNFELLVDTYNDVPYTEALEGLGELTPKYEDAKTIYVSLANQLDSAIATIHTAMDDQSNNPTSNVKDLSGNTDIMFRGNMTKWIQFANTIKLRLVVHAGGKVNFANTTFDEAGFLTTDALVNPGYTRDNGKQNPEWDTWVFKYNGDPGNKAWIATKFILGYYDGTILLDQGRGYASYYNFPSTASNQLGFESNDVPSWPTGSVWYSSASANSDRGSTTAGGSIGILKGPNMSQPLMLAAESYFLQAEAVLKGLITSELSDADLFVNGVKASYAYIYKNPDGSSEPGWDPEADYQLYLDDNPDSYLVHYDLANSMDQKLEAIITQKYVALNMINSNEAWNEYRRTHYPSIVNGSSDPHETFASLQSISTRPDELPTRILYPASESSYNPENKPTDVDKFTSLIFWALP
ncbi:SusD/RagB family nutrient-binding outer membrane lipoprotein [Ilyomonas limi]|uniref:SusD/RagB family nutrient-binding outer membrane lipoprotein n=1 Tax=Ilyomonas limi TaxID=2575867 RepID=A0A4U3L925_9BACT|nr:SusD/RagB family nutrient-binding outer membrane lipoprotein [Ilyomonas limi]TKK70974.1 SusD/RagB family nutrient-binding outer membrane lipoprotein [Ilyomonas limi]